MITIAHNCVRPKVDYGLTKGIISSFTRLFQVCVRPDVDYGLSEGITSKIPKKVLNEILACVRPEVDHNLSEGITSETTRNEIQSA